MEEVTTLVLVPQTVDAVKIPVIAGGGFGDARGFVAALALVAEVVLMGTRFIATQECIAHPNFKEAVVNAAETDTMIIQKSIGDPMRALKNEIALKVQEMESKGATLEELMPFISGLRGRRAWVEGDIQDGVVTFGQVAGPIHDVPTVKEVIDNIINGAKAIVGGLAAA